MERQGTGGLRGKGTLSSIALNVNGRLFVFGFLIWIEILFVQLFLPLLVLFSFAIHLFFTLFACKIVSRHVVTSYATRSCQIRAHESDSLY
ncbi:MAG: hypothetical protein WAU91_05775 [Desulfatitalea sp.]